MSSGGLMLSELEEIKSAIGIKKTANAWKTLVALASIDRTAAWTNCHFNLPQNLKKQIETRDCNHYAVPSLQFAGLRFYWGRTLIMTLCNKIWKDWTKKTYIWVERYNWSASLSISDTVSNNAKLVKNIRRRLFSKISQMISETCFRGEVRNSSHLSGCANSSAWKRLSLCIEVKSSQTLLHSSLSDFWLALKRSRNKSSSAFCRNILATVLSSTAVFEWLTFSGYSRLCRIDLLIPERTFSARSTTCRVCSHCNVNPTNWRIVKEVLQNEMLLSGRNDNCFCYSLQKVVLQKSLCKHVQSLIEIIILRAIRRV